jgi:RNA-directed DNA polymerase
MLRHVNLTLVGWAMRKFKRFQGRKVGAALLLEKLGRIQPALFEHWRRHDRRVCLMGAV